jgi:hypothetical protein
MAEIEREVFPVTVGNNTIQVSVKIRITALDRKAADAVSGLGGAFCDLCHMSADQAHRCELLEEELKITRDLEDTNALVSSLINESGEVPTKKGDWDTRFGVIRPPTVEKEIESTQGLHLLLRATDWILKLAYHEIAEVNHWSEATNMRDIVFVKKAKETVQSHLRDRTGLKVAFPDSSGNGGTTTNGNLCRRLIYEKETREILLELVPDRNRDKLRTIIVRIAVALRVVSSKNKIVEEKVKELEVFNRETYKLILKSYPPPICRISPSVHKLLAHTSELIMLNECHGLGTVSEGGIEACNKLLRRYRISVSRKRNQHDNLSDCAKRLWVNSDPVLEDMRLKALPICKSCSVRGHIARYCRSRFDNVLEREDFLVQSYFE